MRIMALLAAIAAGPALGQVEVISCLLEPSRQITVSPAAQGVIVESPVDRGERVIKGQLLARLESAVEEASLAAARHRAESAATLLARQAQVTEAARQLEQVRNLAARGVASQNQLAELEAELAIARGALEEAEDARAAARLDLRVAEATLEQRMVRAPADGVVLARMQEAGEYGSPDLPMLELVTVGVLYADILLPEAAYGRVRGATPLEILSEGVARGAQVVAVDPLIDAASRTFAVRAALENGDGAFTAGRRCEARFALEE